MKKISLFFLFFLFSTVTMAKELQIKKIQPLTPEERLIELNWFIQSFEEFYAPLHYKESRWQENWESHVAHFREQALKDQSNDSFDQLLTRFVAWSRDGHVSAYRLMDSSGTNHKIVASSLGFLMSYIPETGESIISKVFKKILPEPSLSSPHIGDVILEMDGKPVREYIETEILPYRTVGQDLANLAIGHLYAALRKPTYFSQPHGEVLLKLKRGEQVFDTSLPWVPITHKLFDALGESKGGGEKRYLTKNGELIYNTRDPLYSNHKPAGVRGWLSIMTELFEYQNLIETLSGEASISEVSPPLENKIDFPHESLGLARAKNGTLNAYLRHESFLFSNLFQTYACQKLSEIKVGTLTVSTFICDEENFRTGISKLFRTLESLNVKNLVVDLRGNPGGFLDEGFLIASTFSKKRMDYSKFSLRLSQEWMSEMEYMAEFAEPLSIRKRYETLYEQLKRESAEGRRISSPVSLMAVRELDPLENPFQGRLVFLTDSLCASMCDIFSAMFDQHPDTYIVGEQTMGAGGNVVGVGYSPYRKIGLTQTMSLATNPYTGEYLENNGVIPDVFYQRTKNDILSDGADFRSFLTHYLDQLNLE